MLFIIFLLSLIEYSFCLSVYIDCENGLDSNSGNSEVSAWKTFSNIDSFDFSSTSNIFLKRGCVFDETLSLSGIDGGDDYLTIQPYGDANLDSPKIDLTTKLEGYTWEVYSGNIYYTSFPSEVRFLYINGEKYNISHYPYNAIEDYFYTEDPQLESDTTKINVTDRFVDENFSESDLVGARFVIRSKRWAFHATTVTAYDGARTLTIASGGNYAPFPANYGFFLMNKLWMLREGTFFYDTTLNRLYVWKKDSGTMNNATLDIRVLHADQSSTCGLVIDDSSKIIVKDLSILHTIEEGILTSGSINNVTLSSLSVQYAGTSGAYFGAGLDLNTVIEKSEILDSGLFGINAGTLSGLTIRENYIDRSFAKGPLNVWWEGNKILGHGIQVSGSESAYPFATQIENNQVYSSGYIGIRCGGFLNKVHSNHVKKACFITDDCGLIYWWKGGNHTVTSNLLEDSIGNSYGTSSYPSKKYDGSAQGIYPDDGSSYSIIKGNVVINAVWGFQLHNSRGNIVEDNVVFNSRKEAFYISEDTIFDVYGWSAYNTIRNNIFHSLYTTAVTVRGSLDWLDMFSEWNDNYVYPETYQYYTPTTSTHVIEGISNWHDEIMDAFGFDWASNDQPILSTNDYEHVPFVFEEFYSSNVIENWNFTDGIENWSRWPPANLDAQWDEVDGCYKVYPDNPRDSGWLMAISNTFPIVQGVTYMISFDCWAKCTNTTACGMISPLEDTIRVYVRKNGPDYATVGFGEYITIDSNRKTYTYSFTGSMNYTSSRIDFYVGSVEGTTYFIDNVILQEAKVFIHDEKDDFTVFSNPDMYSSKEIDITEQYCNLDGTVFSQPSFTLEPLEAKLFLNCFCNNDMTCNNMENANTCPGECSPVCGNNVCEKNETILNCPEDCLKDSSTSIKFSFLIAFVIFALFL